MVCFPVTDGTDLQHNEKAVLFDIKEKKMAEKERVSLTNTIVICLHDVRQAKFIIVDFDPTVTSSTRDAGSFIFQLWGFGGKKNPVHPL